MVALLAHSHAANLQTYENASTVEQDHGTRPEDITYDRLVR